MADEVICQGRGFKDNERIVDNSVRLSCEYLFRDSHQ
jgi:hypothetical protein